MNTLRWNELRLEMQLRGAAIFLVMLVLGTGHEKVLAQQRLDGCPIGPGDADGSITCADGADTSPQIDDAIVLLFGIYRGGMQPEFFRRADANRDLEVDAADVVHDLLYVFASGPAPPLDVPLRLRDEGLEPDGDDADLLPDGLGEGGGISFGDFNRDGYPDLFVYRTGKLYVNNFKEHEENPANQPPWIGLSAGR